MQRLQGEAFGTTWHLVWTGPAAETVERDVAAVLERIDQRMSSWRPDSELSEVRRSEGATVVSEETAAVIEQALSLSVATDGAFDPTVEPLMAVWGFRGERRTATPSDEDVARAKAQVGFERVEVFRHGGVPLVNAGGTALDLSAIAKGYAVDQVSWTLSRLGAANHLVEIGGEVRVAGSGPSGLWSLSVDAPDPSKGPGEASSTLLALTNAAVASSGDYRSAYVVDGTKVAHTMDPRTGRPVRSSVLATTVVAPDCATADGWATALMVLDPETGMHAIEARPELEALWVISDGEAQRIVSTSGMGAYLAAAP